MPGWTLQSVEKAAPDAASLTAARKLARPGPWSDLGSTDTLVWGKCQGSGSTPYQVSIDLSGPAYRCSCPSRKFPCKHALALMLLWVRGGGTLEHAAAVPDFAADWAEQRAQRAADATRARPPADPQARARRVADRRALMSAGIDDFSRWLEDLVRGGLAQAGRQPLSWWEQTAARLVDAQLPGLADRVRRIGYRQADSRAGDREDLAEQLLLEAGRWWLATRSWQSFDDLDEAIRADLRVVLGWNQATDDVRAGDAVADSWLVLGAHRTDDGVLQQQRTWLRGEHTGETVQILDFGNAAGGRPLPVARLAGSMLQATLSRYPGHPPRRALFAEEPLTMDRTGGLGRGQTIAEARSALVAARAGNPWLDRIPAVLHAAVRPLGDLTEAADRRPGPDPTVDRPRGVLLDEAGDRVPVRGRTFPLLAHTGGRAATVFGELEPDHFRPLTLQLDDELVVL